jgi:RNA polymerase-binding transcription factor DksA
VEASPDQTDEIQRAAELHLAISNIDRESKELRNARAALRGIHEGTFGVCEECDETIHPKRLAAIRGHRFASVVRKSSIALAKKCAWSLTLSSAMLPD